MLQRNAGQSSRPTSGGLRRQGEAAAPVGTDPQGNSRGYPGNALSPMDVANAPLEAVVVGEQYLLFSLLERELALKAEHIQGVERLADVTPVPMVAPWISGVINLRGSIASVVDLRAFLDLERLPYNPRTRLLSVQFNEMVIGLTASVTIPVVAIIVLGVLRGVVDQTAFVYAVGLCALVVLLGVLTINYFVRRRIQDRTLGLVDVCRNFAGGDRAVRATVTGDDEFAMLAMSLNTLLDSQGFAVGGATSVGGSDAAALQAQIEKLLQEVSAVGDGDLRVQAEVTPDTLGVLADSFNYMIEELAKVVGRVQA